MVLNVMLVLGALETILLQHHMLYPVLMVGYMFQQLIILLKYVIIGLYIIMMKFLSWKFLLVFLLLYKFDLLKLVPPMIRWFVLPDVKLSNPPLPEYSYPQMYLGFIGIVEQLSRGILELPIWSVIIQLLPCIFLVAILVICVYLLVTYKWLSSSSLSLLDLKTNLKSMVLYWLLRILRCLVMLVMNLFFRGFVLIYQGSRLLFLKAKAKIKREDVWYRMIGMKKIYLKLKKYVLAVLVLILKITSSNLVNIIILLMMLHLVVSKSWLVINLFQFILVMLGLMVEVSAFLMKMMMNLLF
ncbi:hypothetical protein 1 [Hubei sobemo-like virus 37]|uniref:hypothetical protein 1 n=1 Tax=Hubei sobemo-like virus 37 TaxID=1923224 RepID=UPI00090BAE6E|nr:hypothetical protein 1 [Hubei sobemo-like virus 37]APG75780.1 hypothetical protein 1 [Hubei sobemo-like virus 37]